VVAWRATGAKRIALATLATLTTQGIVAGVLYLIGIGLGRLFRGLAPIAALSAEDIIWTGMLAAFGLVAGGVVIWLADQAAGFSGTMATAAPEKPEFDGFRASQTADLPPILEDQFENPTHDQLLAALARQIEAGSLREFRESLLASVRPCVNLRTLAPDHYASVGNTRFGGMPDLPQGIDPATSARYWTFLHRSTSARTVNDVLPASGVLCFFIDNQDQTTPKVIFHEGDAALLRRVWLPDDAGFDDPNRHNDDYPAFIVKATRPFRLPYLYNIKSINYLPPAVRPVSVANGRSCVGFRASYRLASSFLAGEIGIVEGARSKSRAGHVEQTIGNTAQRATPGFPTSAQGPILGAACRIMLYRDAGPVQQSMSEAQKEKRPRRRESLARLGCRNFGVLP
jgi:Domain of unknown function (DUF1963)